MTIVTYEVTPTHRYFERKPKDRIISMIEQLSGKTLTIDEWQAYRKRTRSDLASEAMRIVRSLPE